MAKGMLGLMLLGLVVVVDLAVGLGAGALRPAWVL